MVAPEMRCCVCEAPAVASFGIQQGSASRFPEARRTYYAYGDRDTLLTFCAGHFESAALGWPGLVANPVQPVHREAKAGWAVIERVRKRLRDPAVRLSVMLLWRQAARRWGIAAPPVAAAAKRQPMTRRRIELLRSLMAVQRGMP
jgi:hypothetical protein